MEKSKYKKSNLSMVFDYIPIAVLVFYCMLPFIWFSNNYIAHPPEEVGFIDYRFLFDKYLYAWTSHINNGDPIAPYDYLGFFPGGMVYIVLDYFNVPIYIAQRFTIILLFSMQVFFVYKFVLLLTNSKIVSSISIMYSVASVFTYSSLLYTPKMSVAVLLPAFSYFIVIYIRTRDSLYIWINFLVALIFLGVFMNAPLAVVAYSSYIIGLAYLVVSKEVSLRKFPYLPIVKFFSPLLLLAVYVFFIYYHSLYHMYTSNNEMATNVAHLSRTGVAELANIYDFFRGAWWDHEMHNYNRHLWFYDNPLARITSLILLITSFIGIFYLYKLNYRRLYVYWVLLFVLILFLTNGSSPPFGILYSILYDNIPFFHMFREPWAKFTPLLIFISTIMFAYSIKILLDNKNKQYILLIISSLLIHTYPLFTRDAIAHINNKHTHSDVLFPDYYEEIREWSKKYKDENFLVLPFNYNDREVFKWYSEDIGNAYVDSYIYVTKYLFNVVNNSATTSYVHHKKFLNFDESLLKLFGVKYVLVNNDIQYYPLSKYKFDPYDYIVDFDDIKEFVYETPEKIFGNSIYIYKVKQPYFEPIISTLTSKK